MAQTWKLAISPAQRFQLLLEMHTNGRQVKEDIRRAYRRVNSALGLSGPLAILRRCNNVNHELAFDETSLAAVVLTKENAETLLTVIAGDRLPRTEDMCGEFLDLLEDIKTGRDVPDAPDSVPVLDAQAEASKWEPQAKAGG